MMAEVNQHHPTPPPAASSCRNPNKKTVSPAVSRCISRKPWGIICICQKTLSLQLFHPELFQALPLAAAPGGAPERDADGGVGGQPRCPRCPGNCPGPNTSSCVSPIVFQWRGEPRWWCRVSRTEGSGMGQGGSGRPGGPRAAAGNPPAEHPRRGGALRSRGRRRLGRHTEGRRLRVQKGLISFSSTS